MRRKSTKFGQKIDVKMHRDEFILNCLSVFNENETLTEMICQFVLNDDEFVDYEKLIKLQEAVVFVPRIV